MGLGINISNVKGTRFWLDNWHSSSPLINHALRSLSALEAELPVAAYCDEFGNWNFTELYELLPNTRVSSIASMWINTEDTEEYSWFWKLESDGVFSTKSAYEAQIQQSTTPTFSWHKIWTLPGPNKLKIFVWRVLHESLPTATYLCHRHILSYSSCFICSLGTETTLHALRDCSKARSIWLTLRPNLSQGDFFSLDLHDWILTNCCCMDKFLDIPWNYIFMFSIWIIWYWRNCLLHDADFIWPIQSSQLRLSRAKEALDVFTILSHRYSQLMP